MMKHVAVIILLLMLFTCATGQTTYVPLCIYVFEQFFCLNPEHNYLERGGNLGFS
jgi:hypothetical protein